MSCYERGYVAADSPSPLYQRVPRSAIATSACCHDYPEDELLPAWPQAIDCSRKQSMAFFISGFLACHPKSLYSSWFLVATAFLSSATSKLSDLTKRMDPCVEKTRRSQGRRRDLPG